MKASKPISRDNVPTATLHSGLSNSKSTTAPATKVPIHTHQATNSALPKLMNIVYRVVPMAASAARVATAGGKNWARRGAEEQTGEQAGSLISRGYSAASAPQPAREARRAEAFLPYRLVPQ